MTLGKVQDLNQKFMQALRAIRGMEGAAIKEWLEYELENLDIQIRRAPLDKIQILQGQALFIERFLREMEKARNV